MTQFEREVARRIFAKEFNDSTLLVEGEEARDPSYLITPMGEKLNRVYAVGVLTEKENIGGREEPFWRGRISGPTGTFFISAGQYQPEAAASIRELEIPRFVAVVGKVNTYEPDEDTFLTSIRVENIVEVDENERDLWILDAASGLKGRLNRLRERKEMLNREGDVTKEELVEEGLDCSLADGIKAAYDHYDHFRDETFPPSKYTDMLVDALKFTLPEYETAEEKSESSHKETDEKEEGIQEAILGALEKLDPQREGVEFTEVREEARKKVDMTDEEFRENADALREKGKTYEPALGMIAKL